MNNTKDLYGSFKDLEKAVPKTDWRVIAEFTTSPVSAIAIHGGGIEGGTSEVCKLFADLGKYNMFMFEGLRESEADCPKNLELHITSHKFTQPECMHIVAKTIATVSFHGADEKESLCYVGGKNFVHAEFIKYELRLAGFTVPEKIREGLEGYSVMNIANRNMRNSGVQLEISEGLREEFFGADWKKKENRLSVNGKLYSFVSAIKNATDKYLNIP